MATSSRTIFISRDLIPSSPLYSLPGVDRVIGESLLSFSPVSFDSIPESDWIFFYSQQGVHHLVSQQPNALTDRRLAAFGPKTGAALRGKGLTVSFTGDGTAEHTAKSFSLVGRNERVLFARARHSRMSLQKLLAHQMEIDDLIVYDNEPKTSIDLPHCDMLIFTSPLNAKTYFTHYQQHANQGIFAIGKTTQKALEDLGLSNVQIPEEPTEDALANLLIKYFDN
ncbi:MAG: uroporphyrinogen-III synthase [Saprospiraceae bacterium]|nr:uroporphyrinogen-III synthase [Saprospiraceae bacterium]